MNTRTRRTVAAAVTLAIAGVSPALVSGPAARPLPG